MERNLFRDRHPLLHHFIHHASELAELAFILMVLLEILLFCNLIVMKIRSMTNVDTVCVSPHRHRR